MTTHEARDHRWQTLSRRLLKQARRDKPACGICGQPINYRTHYNAPDSPTVDHIRSWRDHPELRYDLGNLAIVHRACNTSKGVKPAALPGHGNASRNWGHPPQGGFRSQRREGM